MTNDHLYHDHTHLYHAHCDCWIKLGFRVPGLDEVEVFSHQGKIIHYLPTSPELSSVNKYLGSTIYTYIYITFNWGNKNEPPSKEAPIMCLCEKKERTYLTLRGLCRDSNLDRYWVTRHLCIFFQKYFL